MKIPFLLAALMLANNTAYTQLVKTLHQTFEVPDSATTLSFQLYEKDKFQAVPWAGNTIMTETNVKLYYASRGVFDFFLDKGRYNFESREEGPELVIAAQDGKRLAIKSGATQCYEEVAVRIFIPDDFTELSPSVWSRPEKESSDERIGAYKPRKKLARESGTVSEELQDAVQPLEPRADTLENVPALILPDSSWQRRPEAPMGQKKKAEGGQ